MYAYKAPKGVPLRGTALGDLVAWGLWRSGLLRSGLWRLGVLSLGVWRMYGGHMRFVLSESADEYARSRGGQHQEPRK